MLPLIIEDIALIIVWIVFFSRESLIDKRIESAVSQMQSVIELGRVIRERKTLPIKVSLCFDLMHWSGKWNHFDGSKWILVWLAVSY